MDHRYIEDNQVAARYLSGRLTPAEVAAFEEHYLDCQHCLGELELGERFSTALKGVASEEAAAALTGIGILGLLARLDRARWLPWAATVLLLLPLGLLWQQAADERSQRRHLEGELVTARGVQINVPVLRLSAVRSQGRSPAVRLTLGPDPQRIVLAVEIAEPLDVPYRATLAGPDGRPVWQGSALRTDAAGALVIALHSSLLVAGDHELEIRPIPDRGQPGDPLRVSFRVVGG